MATAGDENDDEAKRALNELDIDLFIVENDLNEKAAMALRAAHPTVQRSALDQGPLEGMVDKSTGLLGRLHKARSQLNNHSPVIVPRRTQEQPLAATAALFAEVEKFIKDNEIHHQAALTLRGAAPHIQRAVLDMGGMEGENNYSIACMTRIKKAQEDFAAGRGPVNQAALGEAAVGEIDVESFIFDNELEGKAADALRNESPLVQRHVVGMGNLDPKLDKTAGVLTRIKRFHTLGAQQLQQKMQQQPQPMQPMQQPQPVQYGQPAMSPEVQTIVAKIAEVEAFIVSSGLNDRAAAVVRAAPKAIQLAVVERGDLFEAPENQLSAMCGRIREVKIDLAKEQRKAIKQNPNAFKDPFGGSFERPWHQEANAPKRPRVSNVGPGAGPQPPGTPSPRQDAEVRFDHVSAAQRAVAQLNGSMLGSAQIEVSLDPSHREGLKVLVKGLSPDVGQFQLKKHFEQVGTVLFAGLVTPAIPGATITGEVRYSNAHDASTALTMFEGMSLPGGGLVRPCIDKTSKDGTKVIFRGLPVGTEWQALKDLASQAGMVLFAGFIGMPGGGPVLIQGVPGIVGLQPPVQQVSMQHHAPITGPGGRGGAVAEVRFETPMEAKRAQEKLNNSWFRDYQISTILDPVSKDMSKVNIRGLPAGTEWQELKDWCNKAERVAFVEVTQLHKSVLGKGAGTPARDTGAGETTGDLVGNVTFENAQMATRAVAMDGQAMRGAIVSVAIDSGTNPARINVVGLPAGTRSQDLRLLFARYGRVASVDVNVREHRGEWF